MKINLSLRFFLISFICFLQLSSVDAQQTKKLRIKGNYPDKALDLVLLDLKINYRLDFSYEPELVQGKRISAVFPKTNLDNALNLILSGTGLSYKKTGPSAFTIIEVMEEEVLDVAAAEPTRSNFTLKGVIKDKNTGETLPFANILVRGSTNGTTSNVDGYFTLFRVPTDTVILDVSYIGYRNLSFRLHPDMDMDNILVPMIDFGVQLVEVVVQAEREEQLIQASTGISQVGISPAALATLPSFGEKDIFRSLQLLPGISGTNESSSGLYVRGGTPDQNLILFDGFTVYHVDHLFGFFSAFNSNAIKDVQLHKGGFDAEFGGRLSSVVELTGKDGNTEQFNMGAGLSLLSYNGFIEAPFAKGKGSFLVAGRRSFQSQFYSNLFESFTENNQTEAQGGGGGRGGPGGRFGFQEVKPNSYFYDLNAKVTYRPSTDDVISLSFFNGQDNLDNSRNTDNSSFGGRFGGGNGNINFQSNNTDLTNWGNWGASAKWSHRWSDRFYTNANLSYSNYYSERDRRNETTIDRGDSTITRTNGNYEYNDLRDVTFKIDNEWKVAQNNQLEFGIQSTYHDIIYEYTQNDTISVLDRADEAYTNPVYLQDRHTFNNKLILKGGVRASSYSLTNQVYLEPRASLSYLLTDRIKLKGAWGKYYQFATRVVREDIQQGSRDFWLLANDENVPISSAFHYIGGISYETPSLLFDVEAYYKTLDGLSEYTTRFVPSGFGPGRTLNYEEFFFSGTGIAKGIEFLAQKKVGKITGWIGYTLGEVKYDFEAFGDEPFSANQDQTHELKIIGNYKRNKWTFGATFIYATGRPYTAPTGYYEVPLLDGTTADFFEVSAKNGLRLPDYHRFDISATYDFNLGLSKASMGLSIFNFYDRSNVWYKEYEVIEGELLETNVSLLDFTPSLFFSWSLR